MGEDQQYTESGDKISSENYTVMYIKKYMANIPMPTIHEPADQGAVTRMYEALSVDLP